MTPGEFKAFCEARGGTCKAVIAYQDFQAWDEALSDLDRRILCPAHSAQEGPL